MTELTGDLQGKRALVTGAGRGLGRAIALGLAAHGMDVLACARTSGELDSLSDEIRAQGGRCEVHVSDVTDTSAFSRLVNTLPRLDVLVNNAGTNYPEAFTDVSEAHFDTIMQLNVKAAFFATQAVAGKMIREGVKGSIVNISSQMGKTGAPNRSVYCASKWALEGMTKCVAVELGAYGIRINTICPTFIETPMTKPFLEKKEFKDQVLSKIALGRVGEAREVVSAVIFAASDASSLMTGSSLVIDGGWTAW
ncbi:SDR family NAD(P)-dependent oxidoreductase [Castellaniella caeni]|uniref:SDR family NAD(P)-dependent oxidoreductase n=1 Tax=Castellaniella caeni TaxID=266123 RepID=UPI00082DD633|nr:SDR family NAD(P)-dependent oxidoreductase [Castellaniella caeni]